ncbi:efflux RND transporter periplasmic adaptor subunit [Novosphingobium sp. FSY-8]|uniref:Efflux RND transporter periplasmic adaptor subunit n=1 Tax=Novosphingobium ovatum TaxID=1908523 RepID=A0ABW9XG46_9SPHN|nr:efflux RND transporter periplasmic adaptor subunit [Novosphingobium ovatum]NBC37397.1 efflux RND transporter periplasmic adaptor subunit [Novosphingobium ovatum]
MTRNATIASALALSLLAAGGLWWRGGSSAPQAQPAAAPAPGTLTLQQQQRMGIQTAAAQPANSSELGSVPALVTLPPEARVAVASPLGGQVERVFVVNGQDVRAGQPLATVRSVEAVQYGAALARGQAQLAVARANAARTAQLAREGIIAGARADEAQAALAQAQAEVAANARILTQGGAGGNGTITLRAPISGRLAAVTVQTGGPVDPQTAPFVVENTSALMLDLQIPERLAGSVTPGTALRVTVAPGRSVAGTIVSVGGSIDPATRALVARARIASDPALVAGKSVMAALQGRTTAPAATIPATAVARMGDQDVVFVATSTGFTRRAVRLAGAGGDMATVLSGLKPGERVAITGIAELKTLLGGE